MPKITIDGQTCEFEGKKTILQVANDNGIEIPQYCYHEGLSIVASCRICLAEVAQPNPRKDNALELIPKLVPTCQTPAVDGAEVYLKSPKTIANQKSVMEFLLINHPLDCPVCDQAGECHLQDYSYNYGRAESRFEETKIKQPKKDIGPNVLLYSDRCIMCSRCVRFTREITGTNEIGIFGRGSSEQIDVFPGKPLDNELSGNVVDICPVGALLDKDFLMSMRVWNLTKTPSIDGVTASGDNISIEHNQGRIYRVKPRTNIDVNKWWISDEIRYGWRFVHDEERLKAPALNKEGNAASTDWHTATNEVARQLKDLVKYKGDGSLGLLVSPMLASEEAFLLAQWALKIDPGAVIAIGPVPFVGEDKHFPGGYTVRAEKAPNARGVRRALEKIAQTVLDHDEFLDLLDTEDSGITGLIITGNTPSPRHDDRLVAAARDRYTLLIDTLPSPLIEVADVVLPAATWAEKDGCFENVNGRIQSFERAIEPLEGTRPEGQIAHDLMAAASLAPATQYNAVRTREQIAGEFVESIHTPVYFDNRETDLQYVTL
ncbi:molybdopterin-dependent oxidoreductase [Mucisphaera calidilacus]|uniref:NADH-quinone oxidoreductase chain 3 n=1 Tax=Mucisphaera calidilacus TaxID=2527982 RepID=A0A518BWC3_9BACT|nr:molybdopterin-dependent oxidoreductase [Mucisphaera calidilacus]QDU71279.1 NADH-quinone oxidoreductase chain 3 [Mucisphaera calidilacus]